MDGRRSSVARAKKKLRHIWERALSFAYFSNFQYRIFVTCSLVFRHSPSILFCYGSTCNIRICLQSLLKSSDEWKSKKILVKVKYGPWVYLYIKSKFVLCFYFLVFLKKRKIILEVKVNDGIGFVSCIGTQYEVWNNYYIIKLTIRIFYIPGTAKFLMQQLNLLILTKLQKLTPLKTVPPENFLYQ